MSDLVSEKTTIVVTKDTRLRIEGRRSHPRETVNDILQRILDNEYRGRDYGSQD